MSSSGGSTKLTSPPSPANLRQSSVEYDNATEGEIPTDTGGSVFNKQVRATDGQPTIQQSQDKDLQLESNSLKSSPNLEQTFKETALKNYSLGDINSKSAITNDEDYVKTLYTRKFFNTAEKINKTLDSLIAGEKFDIEILRKSFADAGIKTKIYVETNHTVDGNTQEIQLNPITQDTFNMFDTDKLADIIKDIKTSLEKSMTHLKDEQYDPDQQYEKLAKYKEDSVASNNVTGIKEHFEFLASASIQVKLPTLEVILTYPEKQDKSSESDDVDELRFNLPKSTIKSSETELDESIA